MPEPETTAEGRTVSVLIDTLKVGGVEKSAIQQVRYLARQGFASRLLVLRRTREVPAIFSDLLEDTKVEYLDDRLAAPLRLSFKLPFFSFFSLFHITYPLLMPSRVRRGEFGIVVSHNSYTTFTAWTLSRWKGIPYVMFVWDPIAYILGKAYPTGPIAWAGAALRRLAARVDRALVAGARGIALGSGSHAEAIQAANVKAVPVTVIPPGCEIPATVPDHRDDYLVSVTAWKAGKQLEMLVEVVAGIERGQLLVVGKWLDDEYRAEIERLIRDLGAGGRIRIVGEVSEEQLQRHFAAARLCVTPNAELGFGMPSLEAAASGCPFACPPTAGVAAYFTDEVEAFYFGEGDREALRRIVERALRDERLAFQVGQRARKRAGETLSWDAHVKRLRGLLSEAVGEPLAS